MDAPATRSPWRPLGSLLLGVGLLVAAVSPALAASAAHVQIEIHDSFVDDFLSDACGTLVIGSVDASLNVTLQYRDGLIVKEVDPSGGGKNTLSAPETGTPSRSHSTRSSSTTARGRRSEVRSRSRSMGSSGMCQAISPRMLATPSSVVWSTASTSWVCRVSTSPTSSRSTAGSQMAAPFWPPRARHWPADLSAALRRGMKRAPAQGDSVEPTFSRMSRWSGTGPTIQPSVRSARRCRSTCPPGPRRRIAADPTAPRLGPLPAAALHSTRRAYSVVASSTWSVRNEPSPW